MTKIVSGYANPNKKSSVKRLDLKFFNVGLYLTVAVLGAFYLINISDLTVKGFALREFKNQAASLASENVEQEEVVNSLQSYYALNTRTQKLNMVAVDNIEYIKVSNAVVAKK